MASATLHSVANKLNPSSSSAKTKSSNKKKPGAKNLEAPAAAAASEKSSALNSPHNGVADEDEGSGEPAHIREITKQMRNINKKLNSMTKVDAIISENKGTSLDDLVAARKINADQKAQALKKPQLQAQLASLEARLKVFSEIEDGYEKKAAKEKESLLAAHAEELARIREQAKVESEQSLRKHTRAHLLDFSRFLAAAANRRNLGDDTSDEARAFEGALLLVYGGDIHAVDAAEKIITGSAELVPAVDGTSSGVPFSRVKEVSLRDIGGEDVSDAAEASTAVGSDPTIANAGLTEIDDLTTAQITNGIEHASLDDVNGAPAAAGIGAEASNAAADAQWDPTKPGTQEDALTESYEIVPRDPAEVDVAPATSGSTAQQSWSDEMAAEAANGIASTNGVVPTEAAFQEVHHHRGGRRGEHRGAFRGGERGRGGRGGRGFRGDGRGRGGGGRGGRGHGDFRGRGRGGAESS